MRRSQQWSRTVRSAATIVLALALATLIYTYLFGLPFFRTGSTTPAPGTAPDESNSANAAGGALRPPAAISASQHQANVEAKWRSLVLRSTSPQDTLDEVAERLVSRAGGLSDSMRRSLTQRLGKELVARSGSAAMYLSMAESDAATRWLTPTDPQWATIDAWWGYAYNSTPARDDPRSLLSKCVEDLFANRGARFASVSTEPAGARVEYMTVRVAEEVPVRLDALLLQEGAEQRDYWLRATSSTPVTFRVARNSLGSVLRNHAVAHVVVTMIVVETQGGVRFNWQTVFVWDPVAENWFVESTARKGWKGTMWY